MVIILYNLVHSDGHICSTVKTQLQLQLLRRGGSSVFRTDCWIYKRHLKCTFTGVFEFKSKHLLIDSVARKNWIPYSAALLPLFTSLVKPSLQSIVSKQIGPSEQRIAQGYIQA